MKKKNENNSSRTQSPKSIIRNLTMTKQKKTTWTRSIIITMYTDIIKYVVMQLDSYGRMRYCL